MDPCGCGRPPPISRLTSGVVCLIGMMPNDGIMWLINSSFIIGTLLAFLLIPVSIHHHGSGPKPPPAKSLWRMPVFVAVVTACAAIQASHALYYGFSTLDWSAKGMSTVTIGALWALRRCRRDRTVRGVRPHRAVCRAGDADYPRRSRGHRAVDRHGVRSAICTAAVSAVPARA